MANTACSYNLWHGPFFLADLCGMVHSCGYTVPHGPLLWPIYCAAWSIHVTILCRMVHAWDYTVPHDPFLWLYSAAWFTPVAMLCCIVHRCNLYTVPHGPFLWLYCAAWFIPLTILCRKTYVFSLSNAVQSVTAQSSVGLLMYWSQYRPRRRVWGTVPFPTSGSSFISQIDFLR